ncbi:uncharacterized protein LOC132563834 [Ylistrum balloti]|uniref:uncharacterized protein LOC132563834 n=1 Tax=Ylistrum balloti TaxID=509963 RepID=UPI002905C030|nr:uncharacterized protein LOC132563834 [Ylistrum balloti]
MLLYWIVACSLLGGVLANITGQHPVSGTCFCLTTSNVNAHSGPGLHEPVHASLSVNQCYKFHGGILTKDGYTWYQLQNVHGENLWVAGTFLNIASDVALCSAGASTCSDTTAKNLACEILQMHNSGRINLWDRHPSGNHDNAYAYNNIRDTCRGLAASRSSYYCDLCGTDTPGGTVCLSRTLLQFIYDLGKAGSMHVNEIAGACHHCHSSHYLGTAVDIQTSSRNNEIMAKCRSMGGFALDETSHIHCNF